MIAYCSQQRQARKDNEGGSDGWPEQEFLQWLQRHGAVFDCHWPSLKTESGIRGAVATRDIKPGDHMVVIPQVLMMSELHAKADPKYGHVHRLNTRLLGSDNGLALYIMQEMLKEDESFYWPYLRVLPTPHNLRSWDREDLLLLQDHKLVRRTAAKSRQLRALYQETFDFLSAAYPELYTVERFTFELFDFAWSTIQARAFGKRLKCSALVPFADCLNHGNVQTKYDFDVESNGTFRLFPSGNNSYQRHSEVLNSYGRRPNDNLLLDYGFAMLDNEWDTAEVVCSLSPADGQSPLDRRRTAWLRANGQRAIRILQLSRDVWSAELVQCCRCVCLTALELDNLEERAEKRATMSSQSSPRGLLRQHSERSSDANCLASAAATVMPHGELCGCVLRSSEPARRSQDEGHRSGGSGGATRAFLASCGESGQDNNNNNNNSCIGSYGDLRSEGSGPLPLRNFSCRALSAQNEVAALTKAISYMTQARDNYPTTLEHDETFYREARAAPDTPPELLNALIYRVTVKRILERQLEMAETAIAYVQDTVRGRLQSSIEKDSTTITTALPSSWRSNNLLPSPPPSSTRVSMTRGVQRKGYECRHEVHRYCSTTKTYSPSFVSYLSDLEEALLSQGQPPNIDAVVQQPE